MWRQLSAGARARYPLDRFEAAYRAAAATATATRFAAAGSASEAGSQVTVPMHVQTRIFGELKLPATFPTGEEGGSAVVLWQPYLAFPGVHPGESLTRHTALPPRATLWPATGACSRKTPPRRPAQARPKSGEPRRSGPARRPPSGVGPIPASERLAFESQGVPPNALVGVSGLEKILDARLRGTPGGTLRPVGACSERKAAGGGAGSDVDLAASPDGGRRSPRRNLRRYRRDRPAKRTGSGSLGHRARRPPASRVHVQDHHRVRGA